MEGMEPGSMISTPREGVSDRPFLGSQEMRTFHIVTSELFTKICFPLEEKTYQRFRIALG